MKIIVGHSNMDLDCIGSMVLAKYLFPEHVPVRSHLVNPVARKLMHLYERRLALATAAELKGKSLSHVVVVDTRNMDRIAEYLKQAGDYSGARFEVFDHHPQDDRDIPNALVHERPFGANTTQLGLELMRHGVFVEPEDATIALTGIYADTGNFTHANVCQEDFEVASFLLAQGASLSMVKEFLAPLQDKQQLVLFHELLQKLERSRHRGHEVHSCFMELDEDCQGLGSVLEQAFEVEQAEILIGFFFFKRKGKLLIIGRAAKNEANMGELLAAFGGGGHRQAGSGTVKAEDGRAVASKVMDYLDALLEPAPTARDIMSPEVGCLRDSQTLLDASLALERMAHTGAPVLNDEGAPVGFLTLRDISKGRRGGQMHVPVRTYMSKNLISASLSASVRELGELLFERDIGHVPILDGDRVVGIVTRADILAHKKRERERREAILAAGRSADSRSAAVKA